MKERFELLAKWNSKTILWSFLCLVGCLCYVRCSVCGGCCYLVYLLFCLFYLSFYAVWQTNNCFSNEQTWSQIMAALFVVPFDRFDWPVLLVNKLIFVSIHFYQWIQFCRFNSCLCFVVVIVADKHILCKIICILWSYFIITVSKPRVCQIYNHFCQLQQLLSIIDVQTLIWN